MTLPIQLSGYIKRERVREREKKMKNRRLKGKEKLFVS